MQYFSKIIKEIRIMSERLSAWRFLLIWLIPFLYVLPSVIDAICKLGANYG